MSDDRSEISDNSSELIRREMRDALRAAAAAGMTPGESVKAAIRRAAQRLGLAYGRARSLWYGEARRIDAHEADLVRSRVRAFALEEIRQLKERLARLDREVAHATSDARLGAPAGDQDDLAIPAGGSHREMDILARARAHLDRPRRALGEEALDD